MVFRVPKTLGNKHKQMEILGIREMLKFKFMYSLESMCSGGNGKLDRGTVRKSYQASKRMEK